MRWLVEVTSIGKTDLASFVVEAESWQKALQTTRTARGELGPMSGFSIELLEAGFRAVDPMARLIYVVKRAGDDAPLTALPAPVRASVAPRNSTRPPPAATGAAVLAPAAAATTAAPAPAAGIGAVQPPVAAVPVAVAPVAAPAGPRAAVTPPRPSASTPPPPLVKSRGSAGGPQKETGEEVVPSEPIPESMAAVPGPEPEAMPLPANTDRELPPDSVEDGAPGLTPLAPLSARAGHHLDDGPTYIDKGSQPDVAARKIDADAQPDPRLLADAPPTQVIFKREQNPTATSPLTYREYVYAVATGTPEEDAERVLRAQFELVKRAIDEQKQGKLVNLAVFDVVFQGKPPVPPLATLVWKDWKGAPNVEFPRRRPAPAARVATRASNRPAAMGAPPQNVPPPQVQAPVQQPVQQMQQPVPQMQQTQQPVPQMQQMQQTQQPVPQMQQMQQQPVPQMQQMQQPVPQMQQMQQQPVPQMQQMQPGLGPQATMQQIHVVPKNSTVPPPPALWGPPPEVLAAATSNAPSQPVSFPVPAQAMMPIPTAGIPKDLAFPPPAFAPPPQPRVQHFTPTPGPTPLSHIERPSRNSRPPNVRGRASGDELITALFEAMHDLHFLRDALEGAEFCVALALETLPSRAAIVHLYDIDKREFVVACASGPGTEKLLLKRHAESEPMLASAMRRRRAIVYANATNEMDALTERFELLGGAKSLIVAPVMQAGRFLGVIEMVNPLDNAPFTEDEGAAVSYIAEQYAEFVAARGVVTDAERISLRAPPVQR